MFVGGGDTSEPKRVKGGLLGADYAVDHGRCRFSRVYSGENWNPKLRAPLTQPGVNVVPGRDGFARKESETHTAAARLSQLPEDPPVSPLVCVARK